MFDNFIRSAPTRFNIEASLHLINEESIETTTEEIVIRAKYLYE